MWVIVLLDGSQDQGTPEEEREEHLPEPDSKTEDAVSPSVIEDKNRNICVLILI